MGPRAGMVRSEGEAATHFMTLFYESSTEHWLTLRGVVTVKAKVAQ